jgi:hypothetical protein
VDATPTTVPIAIWLIANALVIGWWKWAGRRAKKRHPDYVRPPVTEIMSNVRLATGPTGCGCLTVVLVLCVGLWAWFGLMPIAMEVDIATSGLTVQSSQTVATAQGESLVLHVHMNSVLPQIWGAYVMLDGSDISTSGFSAEVDFSTGADQTISIPLTAPLSPGKHTLRYGYEFYGAPNPGTRGHGPYWIVTSSRTAEFTAP